MIRELLYSGKIAGDDFCAICKLSFQEGDTIVECPTCQSLFHEQHFVEWLEINNYCPVCEHNFLPIINNYSIREQYSTPFSDQGIFERTPNNFITFTKSKTNKDNFVVQQIFSIVCGILLAVLPIILIAIYLGLESAIVSFFYTFPFFLFGMRLFTGGIAMKWTNLRNQWKRITFSTEGIIYEDLKSTITEINREAIKKIHLYSVAKKVGSTLSYYAIKFEIITTKGKHLNFGTIHGANDFRKKMQAMEILNSQIRTLYQIEPIESLKPFTSWLKNGTLCILSCVGYLVMLGVLLIIYYFVYYR